MAVDLSLIFKAYDVRGVYPEQFDEDASRRIGRAFARWAGADRIVLGRDCRLSSPALSEAFVEGVLRAEVEARCEPLAPYKRVKKVVVRDVEFPKTTTGKIRRGPALDGRAG